MLTQWHQVFLWKQKPKGVFMTNNTPSGTEKHCKSTESEGHQTAKMFSFFLLLRRRLLFLQTD